MDGLAALVPAPSTRTRPHCRQALESANLYAVLELLAVRAATPTPRPQLVARSSDTAKVPARPARARAHESFARRRPGLLYVPAPLQPEGLLEGSGAAGHQRHRRSHDRIERKAAAGTSVPEARKSPGCSWKAALSDLARFRSSAAPPVAPDRTLEMSPLRSSAI